MSSPFSWTYINTIRSYSWPTAEMKLMGPQRQLKAFNPPPKHAYRFCGVSYLQNAFLTYRPSAPPLVPTVSGSLGAVLLGTSNTFRRKAAKSEAVVARVFTHSGERNCVTIDLGIPFADVHRLVQPWKKTHRNIQKEHNLFRRKYNDFQNPQLTRPLAPLLGLCFEATILNVLSPLSTGTRSPNSYVIHQSVSKKLHR